VTSNIVLAETATRLRYDAEFEAALQFRRLIEEAVAVGALSVRYSDCVGAVAAREARAAAVFGLDTDFSLLGFALEP
jgi:hypothetical protein